MSIRTILTAGWRPITEAEKQVVIDWYLELGNRMGITDVPTDFAAYDAWFSAYEARMLHRTEAGEQLRDVALGALCTPIPRPLRRVTKALVPVLIDEPARSALGFRRPNLPARAAVAMMLSIRARRRRRNGPPAPFFEIGAPNVTYPDGWTLDDLGPHRARQIHQR